MVVHQTLTAIRHGRTASFAGADGTAPYTYEVVAGGAGGTINGSGLYTAPSTPSDDPRRSFDTILVTDADDTEVEAVIAVLTPLELVADIIKTSMGLSNGQVFLYNQKIDIPRDERIYIAVGIGQTKVFANNSKFIGDDDTFEQSQYVSMSDMVTIDIMSRGPGALNRRGELAMALGSAYSKSQQEANGIALGRVPSNFVNLSQEDGAAIPYRFNISVTMQYSVKKVASVSYFDTFEDLELETDN